MALVHEAKFRVKQILSGLLINGERVKEVFRYCDAPGPLWVLERRTRGYKEQHKARIAQKNRGIHATSLALAVGCGTTKRGCNDFCVIAYY